MLKDIRAFFFVRDVLEVETPYLSAAGTTDPSIESFVAKGMGRKGWLHTSPEFPMKRLLAAGSGDIYQIARVFRDGESGRYHNPEFTLLEWYRVGLDHHALMQEVVELIAALAGEAGALLRTVKISYRELCLTYLELDPWFAEETELQTCARRMGINMDASLSKDAWLDLLLSHSVMPQLDADQLTLLYDYPASQAALARLNDDEKTAARFEVFWGGVELANGFYELQDAQEQRQRFSGESKERDQLGSPQVAMDECLLMALDHGLPDCSGVALGLDRLLMKLTASESIDQVLAFPMDRA